MRTLHLLTKSSCKLMVNSVAVFPVSLKALSKCNVKNSAKSYSTFSTIPKPLLYHLAPTQLSPLSLHGSSPFRTLPTYKHKILRYYGDSNKSNKSDSNIQLLSDSDQQVLNKPTSKASGTESNSTIKTEPSSKLFLSFTCKVCDGKNSYMISKRAYNHGVVIVTCQSCSSRHLIADNLDWFPNSGGKNIEEIMAEKGEKVLKFASKDVQEIIPQE